MPVLAVRGASESFKAYYDLAMGCSHGRRRDHWTRTRERKAGQARSRLQHFLCHLYISPLSFPFSILFGEKLGRRRGGSTMTAGHLGCAEERQTVTGFGYATKKPKNHCSALGRRWWSCCHSPSGRVQQGNIQYYKQTKNPVSHRPLKHVKRGL